MFVIKGTSTGWPNFKKIQKKEDSLGLLIISLYTTWEMNIKNQNREYTRQEGKINKAFLGLENDIHNLACIISMMNNFSQNEDIHESRKDGLFISVLLENYFTNLRSLFDFTTLIIRMCIKENHINNLPSRHEESFSRILKFVKNINNEGIVPDEIAKIMVKHEEIFRLVQEIRDLIIHKGDEPIIFGSPGNYGFAILKQIDGRSVNIVDNIIGCEEEYYPLFEYLSEITNRVFLYLQELGQPLYNSLCEIENKQIPIWISALEGVCIKEFNDFLEYNS